MDVLDDLKTRVFEYVTTHPQETIGISLLVLGQIAVLGGIDREFGGMVAMHGAGFAGRYLADESGVLPKGGGQIDFMRALRELTNKKGIGK